ncbi:hypothetical protein CK203_039412 [Vitis vinifera]|uniref:Uncharacterized protein n=1 Tax=Vitis vinifera TaxID=29760 RepID=A0A438I7D2_VITVI|nr:hypothetical protein CK203_039412 [Vitis vinifera]
MGISNSLQDHSRDVSLSPSLWQSMPSPCGIRIQSLGQRVLLYDSKLHIFPGKLKSRWIGPFTIHQVHSNGVVELLNSNSTGSFKVNGHRLKPFVEPFSRDKEEFILLDPHQA